jgi:hypothetical protein
MLTLVKLNLFMKDRRLLTLLLLIKLVAHILINLIFNYIQ